MRISFRCILALLLLVAATGVHAQANDDWANRTQIASLPFEVATQQMSGATTDASDPVPNCQGTNQSSYGTIWFGYTTGASPEILTLRVSDFQVATVLAVYTGSPGAFRLAPGACARAGGSPNNAQLAGVRLAPNTAYSILLSAQSPIGGLSVHFTVAAAHLYNVTKTDDTFDGTCDADCSLREAIEAANVAAEGAGAVIVPVGHYVLTRTGTGETDNATGDLDLRNDMGIYGAGMGQTIIDANSIDRVINVVTPAQDANTLILGDLTLTHGNATDAVSRGGAINNNPLTPSFIGLERVALVDNHAAQTGGGLDTGGSGTIRESRFSLNNVTSGAGGGGGGALLFNPQDRPFEIESSTFDANDGGDYGGAIETYGNLRLTNSTISGNHVAQHGGGIFVVNGPFQMSSTTVAFNKAGTPAFWNLGGGLFLESSFNYELFNNIIAGNTVDDCLIFSGTIDSHHNHIQAPGQNTTACTFAGTGDVVGTDPKLDPQLADNGGPTPTHALPFTSPAHDAGDPAGCNAPDGLPLANDQRGAGFPRLDGKCDKGAFEQSVLFANGFEP